MLEKDLWAKVRKGMGARWRSCRIENRLDEGTPDVFFTMQTPKVSGMIELKSQDSRKNGNIVIPHFTQEQRDFIRLYHTFLLLYCNKHYLLFGPTTGYLVGLGQSFDAHKEIALYSSDRPDWDDFTAVLVDQLRA